MKKNLLFSFWILLVTVFIFTGCHDDDDDENCTETASVEIRLTDAPAPYDAVNIHIRSVSLLINSEWVELDLLHPGIYNLLDFQNGVDTLLAGEDVPAGTISQIRLILGDDGNSVVKDGQTYPLETPSAQQSGLKLNLYDELFPGIAYKFWIDFDASRSIVQTGSGKYQLKPVMRTYTNDTSGSLRGVVLPLEANAVVWAILGTDSIMVYPHTDGNFHMAGLQPSISWKIIMDADIESGYKNSQLSGVSIVAGQVNDLGSITLKK